MFHFSLDHPYRNRSVSKCRLHNISLWYSLEVFDERFDIYWMKYPLLKKLMVANPDIEWFMVGISTFSTPRSHFPLAFTPGITPRD
jgi:hypothetical protein